MSTEHTPPPQFWLAKAAHNSESEVVRSPALFA